MKSILDYSTGIHADIPADAYHQRIRGVANKGLLDRIRRAPAVAKHWLDGGEDDETPALRFGKIAHHAILEPELYARRYAIAPEFGDCRSKENKATRDAWRRDHAGQIEITGEEARCIGGMVASLRSHPLASQIIRDGQSELTAIWEDKRTGLRCKARADYWVAKHGMLVDVKTCEDASKEGFRKSIANWGYHRQDPFYREGFLVCGADVRHFLFVAVEKKEPYLVAVHSLAPQVVEQGHASVREDMQTLATCLETDEWPGLDPTIQVIDDLPYWAA